MKYVDLIGLHREASTGAPLVLLREHDAPHRVLPILVGPNEAASIALALGGTPPPRPITHDLIAAIVDTLDAHVERVEVTELRDGTFVAELAVAGPMGARRLDSRPSDAIALAVRVDAPLYVAEAVLDEAGAVLAEGPDEDVIDDEVSRFRSFLEALSPTEFHEGLTGEAGASGKGGEGPEAGRAAPPGATGEAPEAVGEAPGEAAEDAAGGAAEEATEAVGEAPGGGAEETAGGAAEEQAASEEQDATGGVPRPGAEGTSPHESGRAVEPGTPSGESSGEDEAGRPDDPRDPPGA